MTAQPVISARGLGHTYKRGNKRVFDNVSLDIHASESLVLLGPSGGGKSTFLRCINRLVRATTGSLEVFGTDMVSASQRKVRNIRRQIGMIFQGFNLIDRIPVIDNVMIGRLGYLSTTRSVFGFYRKQDIAEAMAALDRVGLADEANSLAMNLSGGQRQRVGIARALVQRPKILLADEPVSNLDPLLQRDILTLLQDVCREDKITTIMSLHNIELARNFASRLISVRDHKITAIDVNESVDDQMRLIYG